MVAILINLFNLQYGDIWISQIPEISADSWISFYKWGPQTKILIDIDILFCSKLFKYFLDSWGIQLCFQWAYVPVGNGIVERYHIKSIATWKQCEKM